MTTTINIPESLQDITLEQYQAYLSIENPTQEDLLICFLKLELKDFNAIKASEFDRLVIHINSLFEVEQIRVPKFDLQGIEFGFIPNLDEISYGENKDITTYINDWQQMHIAMSVLYTTYINDWQKMHIAMSVLYRPVTQKQGSKKYLIEPYNGKMKYAELMKQMPLSVVMGSMVFFYNLTNELLNCIPSYLEKATAMALKNKEISAENGEAIRRLTSSLEMELVELSALVKTPQLRTTLCTVA